MVLLVVDTQKGIVDERLYAFETFVSNIRELIRTAREQGIEVVYVQHDDGPGTGFSIGDDEFEVYSGFAPLLTEKRFVKTVCSAFKKESGLLEYLTEKGEKDVMVCGIMTDFCINATVEAGFEHGLHIIVPAYANSTQNNECLLHCFGSQSIRNSATVTEDGIRKVPAASSCSICFFRFVASSFVGKLSHLSQLLPCSSS